MKSVSDKMVRQGDESMHNEFWHKGAGLSNLSDGVYLFMDISGKVIEVSPSLQQLFGYTAEEMIAHSFFTNWVVPNMGKALIKQVLCDKIIRRFVTDIQHKDGHTVVTSINAQFVMDRERRLAGIECLVSDVSDLQQKEDRFDETLRNITGGIAHLINNQMASVVGTADLVKMQLWDRPELAEKLDRISQSGLEAGDVAHNLVAYAQTGEDEEQHAIDLNTIITSVTRTYKRDTFETHPRKLGLKVEPGLYPIMANEHYLQKMLGYLLSNAVDATDESGEIVITSENVIFPSKNTGKESRHVMLSVRDNGHGMDKEAQKRIFEPFFSTRFQGRGMSMAHVLKIIDRYDGHIHVRSKVDKGSIITIHFPAAASS